jgi:hypothetical protein
MEVTNTRLLMLVALSAVIALSLAYLILILWDERKALVFLLYGIYVMGAASSMPTRTPIGYSFSVGVAIGLVIPIGIWLVQGP